MVFRREGIYAIVAILGVLVIAATFFTALAWAQRGSSGDRSNEARRQQVESLTPQQTAREFQEELQAAQTDESGDLIGNPARESADPPNGDIDLIRILDAQNCVVEQNATIVFEDQDGNEFLVVDNLNVQISGQNDVVRITDDDGEGAPIEFFDEEGDLVTRDVDDFDLSVENSSGIDCDGDNDDGFDDELLLLLLLELLEDADNDNDDDNGDNDNDRRERRDERIREQVNDVLEEEGLIDEDGDGDIDQDDELIDAQEALDGEITDGEFTDADDFDDGDDGPAVSADAGPGGAEASTPGAVARSGGDPDELEPLRSAPDDVVNEIPTSGPLPNTGGMPMVYWLLPLAGLLILAGLPVYRWIKSRG